jgi:hypothetical protein
MNTYQNIKNLFCLLQFVFIILANPNFTQGQTSNHNVLISGNSEYEDHDLDVKQSFLIGYSSYNGTEFDGNVDLYLDQFLESLFTYAENNNYDIIVRSYAGLNSYISIANDHPAVKLFMPSGSNSPVLTFSGDLQNCPIIVTGAGVDSNVTGYQIDFYSIDPITSNNLSSFSNGYIAGQIAFISDYLDITVDEARTRARETGSNGGIYDYQNGYGSINVGEAINGPVPVELVSFTGIIDNGEVFLKWETATEINNFGWEVERTFKGLEKFELIGFVEGAGNSNSPKNYSFKDIPTQYGNYLYRIKQIDNDGIFEYNGTVSILYEHNQPGEEYLSAYPNPFNPQTNIVIAINYKSFVRVNIYNSIGEKITTIYSGLLDEGEYNFSLNGQNFSSGIYIVMLQTEREILKHKVVLLK